YFDPSPAGMVNLTSAGSYDVFLAKYSNSTGALQWARSYGGTDSDVGTGVPVVDSVTGSVYIGGYFNGAVDFNPAAADGALTSLAGSQDGFLLKVDASGNFQNAWRMGSDQKDGGVRPMGVLGTTVYFTHHYRGTADYPTGDTLTFSGGTDIAVIALDESA